MATISGSFSVGIMTTAPVLGVVIPPSISMILYAMVSNDSLEALFLTGFVPGLLIMVAMSLYAWFVLPAPPSKRAPPTFRELLAVLRESIWACCCRC
jgi:TRAP-type C4-dicarboxylate transport system permease large subunit